VKGSAELIGGEGKAQTTAVVLPPARICNAAIAFERPAELFTFPETRY